MNTALIIFGVAILCFVGGWLARGWFTPVMEVDFIFDDEQPDDWSGFIESGDDDEEIR